MTPSRVDTGLFIQLSLFCRHDVTVSRHDAATGRRFAAAQRRGRDGSYVLSMHARDGSRPVRSASFYLDTPSSARRLRLYARDWCVHGVTWARGSIFTPPPRGCA
jgi:hypothetical protein